MDKQQILDGIRENPTAFIYYHYEELTDEEKRILLFWALDELKTIKVSKFDNDMLSGLELYLRKESDGYEN